MTRRALVIIGWTAALTGLPGCQLLAPFAACNGKCPDLRPPRDKSADLSQAPTGAGLWTPQPLTKEAAGPAVTLAPGTDVPPTDSGWETKPKHAAPGGAPSNPVAVASPYHATVPVPVPTIPRENNLYKSDYPGKAVEAVPTGADKDAFTGLELPLRHAKITNSPAGAAPPPSRKEPIVLALEQFLENHPEQALDHLRSYDEGSQEFFLRMLPVLAQMTNKPLDQLEPEQTASVYEQLDRVMTSLRARSSLVIDQMCFCEGVESYGVYQPLPADHAYRAGGEGQPGELVQVYVQMRNLCPEKCDKGYETRLVSSVRIHRADQPDGEPLWFYSFKERERPLQSQTPRRDHFNNYSFYVPPGLPAGSYTLTIEIRDVTRPGEGRVARKSLPFRVAA